MGMAASQARLLSITSRIADNELRAQLINNSKMRLATDSSRVSEEYVTALNDAVMMISNHDVAGNEQYQQLTYNALTSYSSHNNQYGLINSSGQILVSESEANLFKRANGDVNTYLSLHELEYDTSYFSPKTFGLADASDTLPIMDDNGNVYAELTASELAAMYKTYEANTNSVEFTEFNNLYATYQRAYDAYRPELTKAIQSYLTTAGLVGENITTSNGGETATDYLLKSALPALEGCIDLLCIGEDKTKLKSLIETNYTNRPDEMDDVYIYEENGHKWLVRSKSTNFANDTKNTAYYNWNGTNGGKAVYDNGYDRSKVHRVYTVGMPLVQDGKGEWDRTRGPVNITTNDKGEWYLEVNPYYISDFLLLNGWTKNADGKLELKDGNDVVESLDIESFTSLGTGGSESYWKTVSKYIQLENVNCDLYGNGKLHPSNSGQDSNKTVAKLPSGYSNPDNMSLNFTIKYRASEDDTFIKETFYVNTYQSNQYQKVMQVLSDEEVQAIYREKYETVYNSIGAYYDFETANSKTVITDKLSDSGKAAKDDFDNASEALTNFLFSGLTPEQKSALQAKYANLGDLFNYVVKNSNIATNDKFDEIKNIYILEQLFDTYGEPKLDWVDTNNVTGDNASAKAQWYTNLFERMQQGYAVLEKGLASSQEWINNAFKNGQVTAEMVNKTNKWTSISYSNITDITEVTDENAVAIAEAEYKKAMNKIENKDKRFDMELKNIDTEHNSLQQEYDSIKSVISKNIERTFKMYS